VNPKAVFKTRIRGDQAGEHTVAHRRQFTEKIVSGRCDNFHPSGTGKKCAHHILAWPPLMQAKKGKNIVTFGINEGIELD
jgi:hypothetical protein